MNNYAETESKQCVFIVDDEPAIVNAIIRESHGLDLNLHGFSDPVEALEALSKLEPDLIISDVKMPNINGIELLEKASQKLPYSERILLTGHADIEDCIGSINRGKVHHYLKKPWDPQRLRKIMLSCLNSNAKRKQELVIKQKITEENEYLEKSNEKLGKQVQTNTQELNLAYKTTFYAFARLIDKRMKKYGCNDGRQIARLCCEIAEKMGISYEKMGDLRFASILKNIGKLSFDDELLSTPYFSMTEEQKKNYQQHPTFAALLIAGIKPLEGAQKIISSYCEQPDGKGYPLKAHGDKVERISNILLFVSDYHDGLGGYLRNRPYSEQEFFEWAEENKGHRYHSNVVDTAKQVIMESNQQFEWSGEYAVLTSQLKTKMVLSRDLKLPTGILLLVEGTTLHPSHIKHIRQIEEYNDIQLNVFVYQCH